MRGAALIGIGSELNDRQQCVAFPVEGPANSVSESAVCWTDLSLSVGAESIVAADNTCWQRSGISVVQPTCSPGLASSQSHLPYKCNPNLKDVIRLSNIVRFIVEKLKQKLLKHKFVTCCSPSDVK